MDKKLGRELISWYEGFKRDLPWRDTKDPYLIWVSEIILQQTRVDQGLPYYFKFVEKFPNITSLATASEEAVLKNWQGLGYYSRARNMHASAKQICEINDGKFPETYEQILQLKGIGPYTAAAISSIAFNKPYPVVDGNVSRVVSRLFGIEQAVNTALGLKIIEKKLKTFFVEDNPGTFNQAIMELGALVCKPKSPDCALCVLKENCFAFSQQKTELFPVKLKLKKPKLLYLYYFVLKQTKGQDQMLFLNKRKENAIWKNLYDFPCIELEKKGEINKLITDFKRKNKIYNINNNLLKITGPVKHQLTHRTISAYFVEVNVDGHFRHKKHPDLIPVVIDNLINYPVPKLIENYLKIHVLGT